MAMNVMRATKRNKSRSRPRASTNGFFQNNKKDEIPNFRKYEVMLKVGVDLSLVTRQMTKDNLSSHYIEQFEAAHADRSQRNPTKLAQELGLPQKPQIPTPSKQTKKVYWKPVALEQIKTSIWNKVNQQWIDYDSKSFESTFQVRYNKHKMNKNALKYHVGTEHDQRELIEFIHIERSQQVRGGLKSFNLTNEQLRIAILSFDETVLNANDIALLVKIAPNVQEQYEAETMSQKKDVMYFGVVERFFYSLHDIIELKQRLKSWLFKMTFMERVNKLNEKLTVIEQSKNVVMRSSNLKAIFAVILALGNHMNYGNKRIGNVYGFHLSDLNLLTEITTIDNSRTFPMYLYSLLHKKYPHLLDVIREFKMVGAAANIDLDVMEREYIAIIHESKELTALVQRYEEDLQTLRTHGTIINAMKEFENTVKHKLWKLKLKYDGYTKSKQLLIKYFAYNPEEESVSMQTIFKDLYTFIDTLKQSKIKLMSLKKDMRRKYGAKTQKPRSSIADTVSSTTQPKPAEDQQLSYDHIMQHIDHHIHKQVEQNQIDIEVNRFRRTRNKKSSKKHKHSSISSIPSVSALPTLEESASINPSAFSVNITKGQRSRTLSTERRLPTLTINVHAEQIGGNRSVNDKAPKSLPTSSYLDKKRTSFNLSGQQIVEHNRKSQILLLTPSASALSPVEAVANVESGFAAVIVDEKLSKQRVRNKRLSSASKRKHGRK